MTRNLAKKDKGSVNKTRAGSKGSGPKAKFETSPIDPNNMTLLWQIVEVLSINNKIGLLGHIIGKVKCSVAVG